MDNVDVIEKVVTEEPELPVHVPYANYNSPGIASFNSTDFHVEQDGEVQLSKEIKAIREDAEEAAEAAASSAEEATVQASLAKTYMQSAQTAASDANNSALSASGSAVQSSTYAEQAKQSAQDAADSATEAHSSQMGAFTYATQASSSAEEAKQSASQALNSSNLAGSAVLAAQTAAQNAEQSATDAETFAGNAETSASQAADSALLAQQYRDQAKDYAKKEYQVYDSFDSLPRPGDSAFIYLVPVTDSKTNNKYNEYLWIENINDYEFLGTANDIDLSNYAQQNGTYPDMSVGKATADANGNNIVNTYATKAENNAKYTKPSSGIPESDLAQAVKDKLNEDVGIQNYEVIVRQTLPAADANSPDFVQTADGKIYRKKVITQTISPDESVLQGMWVFNTSSRPDLGDVPGIGDYNFGTGLGTLHMANGETHDFGSVWCPKNNFPSNWVIGVCGEMTDVDYWNIYEYRNSTPRWLATSVDFTSYGDSYKYKDEVLQFMQTYATKQASVQTIYSYEEIPNQADVNAKYTKPSGGIPKTDLASAVQTSLNKADTALQSVPLATSSAIGGVKPVAKTDDMTQSVGVDASGALFTAPSGGTIEYMTNEEVDALFSSTPSIPSFADATWEQIAQVAEAGTASNYFAVGDEKTITLSTDEQVTLVILGFNHDDLSDGSGKAGITIGMKNLLATEYRMNSTNTNVGGWDESEMRTSTMATFLSQLPSDLQGVIKQVNKKATAGGASTSITTSADKLWLLAMSEIFSATSIENSSTSTIANYADAYNAEGTQYKYYENLIGDNNGGTDKNSLLIKKLSNGSGRANGWWPRSPYVGNSSIFRQITLTGGVSSYDANGIYGVSFNFCV